MNKALVAIGVVNGAAALLEAGSCLAGMKNPAIAAVGSEVTDLASFYARAYGARALPISAAVLALLALRRHDEAAVVLTIDGLSQVGDAALGVSRRNPGMTVGAATLAAIHLGSAWLLRGRGRPAC
jgi:hypothetical protein